MAERITRGGWRSWWQWPDRTWEDLYYPTPPLRTMASGDTQRLADVSPKAWRLLRVAAGYEQREVEREVEDLLQAHVSMLESGSRGLSGERRRQLFELYVTELTEAQVEVLVERF